MGNNRRGKGGNKGGGAAGNYYGGGNQQKSGSGYQGQQGGGGGSGFGFGRNNNINSNNNSNYHQNNASSSFGFGQKHNQSNNNNFYQQNNPYSALSSGGGSGGGGSGYQGNRSGSSKPPSSGGPQPKGPWQEVVKTDWFKEGKIMWYLTCYGHEREQQNDLVGDTSPEELRWAQMSALQAGKPLGQVIAEHNSAVQAKAQEVNELLRAPKPPSLGGPAIRVQPATQTQGSPFGQQAPSFGQQRANPFGQPAQPVNPFGQPAQPANPFGQPAQPANPFGQGGAVAARPSGGFGFGAGAAPAARSNPFGRPAGPAVSGASPFATAPAASPFGSSSPAPSPFAAVAPAPAPPSTFGQQGSGAGLQQAGSAVPGGSPAFGQLPAPTGLTAVVAGSPPAAAAAAAAPAKSASSDADTWAQPKFQRGQIPETAPAPAYCA